MELSFIGDAHGKFSNLKDVLSDLTESDRVYQLGDFGIGFPKCKVPWDFPENFKFIRGNHDNPSAAQNHPSFLGDYGVDEFGVGFLGGAYSIDVNIRTVGIDWWPGEELSYKELCKAVDFLVAKKPEVIITHSAPEPLRRELVIKHYPNRTDQALDALWDAYQPRFWFCGHFHKTIDMVRDGTHFMCLNELDTITIEL